MGGHLHRYPGRLSTTGLDSDSNKEDIDLVGGQEESSLGSSHLVSSIRFIISDLSLHSTSPFQPIKRQLVTTFLVELWLNESLWLTSCGAPAYYVTYRPQTGEDRQVSVKDWSFASDGQPSN